jgi:Tfp pilus assembly protein PilN
MLDPVTPKNNHVAPPVPQVPSVPPAPTKPSLDVPIHTPPRSEASVPSSATSPNAGTKSPSSPAPSRSNSVVATSEDTTVFTISVVLAFLVFGTWAVLALMGAKYGADVTNAQEAIAAADTQMKSNDLSPTVEQYQSLEAAASNMERVRNSRYLLMPVWNTLKAKVPKDVQFTSVSLGQDNVFRVSGVTKSISSVADFAKALEGEKGISEVSPLSIDKESGTDRLQFTLTFKAKPVTTETTQ